MSACQISQSRQTGQMSQTRQASQVRRASRASQISQASQSRQAGQASQIRQGVLGFLKAPLAAWGLGARRGDPAGEWAGEWAGNGAAEGAGQVLQQAQGQARVQTRMQARGDRGRRPGAPEAVPDARVFTGAPGVAQSLATLKEALRASQKACLAASCLSLLLGTGCAALLLARPEPVYFGMSEDMKLLPMVPLDRPVMGDAAVKAWVAESVTLAMNLDYLNFASQLNQARGRFTRTAFAKFAASLDKEGHLPLLRQQRALMHSVVQGTPLLVRSGLVRGRLVQEFELPLLVSYETSKGRISSNQVAVVCQVQRVPVADYPRGLAISSLVTLQRRARE